MAAHLRGDAAEQNRLMSSVRMQSLQVPDYYPLARAQAKAVFWHMLTLLDLAGHSWQWWGLWMTYALPDTLEEDRRGRCSPRTDSTRSMSLASKSCSTRVCSIAKIRC